MSNLSSFEKRELEKLFKMESGYVLGFSDRTFSDFFADFKIDIDSQQYKTKGQSKAKRMRAFWDLESNYTVGLVVTKLIEHGINEKFFCEDDPLLIERCRKIAQRLLNETPVVELESLTAITDEYDFDVVAEHIREAIEKNQPEGGLDRLHTFVNKFIRVACEAHGIIINRDKPLHSIFGEYVKALRNGGHLESEMTDRILKSSISVLESFNHVRNNKSLAHDNPILNYEESILIFNYVAASIRFIRALDKKIKMKNNVAKEQKSTLPWF